jgi:hypothetical protein
MFGLRGQIGLYLLVTGGLLSPGWAQAAADLPDTAAMQQEITRLRQRLDELELRLRRLETGTGPAALPAPAVPPAATSAASPAPFAPTPAAIPVQPAPIFSSVTPASIPPDATALLRTRWARVVQGTAQDEVSALLGPPSKKLEIDGRVAWLYAYPGLGQGSVFFTDAGRVSSRQAPMGWAGWNGW